ncbi:helix-turn-helix domain-containing protein [Altererythrobacter sp.]|uniref:helix-turn-helix domain-containing protein n=1 Tax=Altererythrobacter sp. TaxID=1872480 RepID=UPI003D018482
MDRTGEEWRKFSLYGEEWAEGAPEFLHIETVSARSRLHDWNISPHSHPHIHQLLLLERGSGRIAADGDEEPLSQLTLVAVPSLCVHAFAFDPGSEGWVVSIAEDMLHDPRLAAARQLSLFRRRRVSQSGLQPGSPELARLVWLLADLGAGQADGHAARMTDVRAAQLSLLLACADDLLGESSKGVAANRRRQVVDRFRVLVDDHFAHGWTVADYARQLATTEQTLNRACHSILAKPPGAVIHERLLLEAMRYLSFSGASVKEIAARLGFSDPAYFARFFKKMTGRTASEFRKQRDLSEPSAAS